MCAPRGPDRGAGEAAHVAGAEQERAAGAGRDTLHQAAGPRPGGDRQPHRSLDDLLDVDLDDVSFLSFCVKLFDYDKIKNTSSGMAAPTCAASKNLRELAGKELFKQLWNSLSPQQRRELLEEIAGQIGEEGLEELLNRINTPAQMRGDPHLITLDGFNYDLQNVGEFAAVQVPDQDVELQTRFEAAGPNQSAITAVAFNLDERVVELRADGQVYVDGARTELTNQKGFFTGEHGYLIRDGQTYRASWPADEAGGRVGLAWTPGGGIGALGLSVPPGVATTGLLGDHDGIVENDLRLRDGTPLSLNATQATLHGTFANSWRISDAESLFTYPQWTSTVSYTDLSFRQSIVTADDFTETQRAEAMNICEQNGMVPGPSFDDCELDILVTGYWAFAATAATITIPSVAAGDRLLDAAGHLDVDFEAPVPANLRALRVGRDSGIGSFAGPLSGTEQYRFYVPQLAHHDQATIEFDAHAIGTWDPTDALQVRVDDVPSPASTSRARRRGSSTPGWPTARCMSVCRWTTTPDSSL